MSLLHLIAALSMLAAQPPSPVVTPAQAPVPQLAPGETPPAEWLRGEWMLIIEQPSVAVSIDEGATRRDGDRVRLRLRALLTPAEYEGARYGLTEMELDCRRHTVLGISLTEYDSAGRTTRDRTGGEAMTERPWPEGDPVADSFAAACHRTDPEAGE